MKRDWRFAMEFPISNEWVQHLHSGKAKPNFPIPTFDSSRSFLEQPFRMLVFPKAQALRQDGHLWLSREEHFAVPLDFNAMKQRGWRAEYAEINLEREDPRFKEFFQNWIKYCCSIFREDIDAACQLSDRLADTHTLVFAPLGVTFHLTLSAEPWLYIKGKDVKPGAEYETAIKDAENIKRIATRELRSVAERFCQSYRNCASGRQALGDEHQRLIATWGRRR
jgi:hypothetical protein